jgi:hypothetical protein
MPTSVRRAAQLLWASFILSAALGGLYLVGAVASVNLLADVASAFVACVLIALIATKVGAGRNWARWLFVVIYILGSAMYLVLAVLMPEVFLSLPGLLQVSALVQFTLQTGALVLMFTRPSRQWFGVPV